LNASLVISLIGLLPQQKSLAKKKEKGKERLRQQGNPCLRESRKKEEERKFILREHTKGLDREEGHGSHFPQ